MDESNVDGVLNTLEGSLGTSLAAPSIYLYHISDLYPLSCLYSSRGFQLCVVRL